jgi:glutamate racemase
MPPPSEHPAEGRACIGVLDSGVGGLCVVRAIHQALPDHPTVFCADQAHLPYGPRDAAEIRGFVRAITRFLLAHDAVVVVVACNAASAASLTYLRDEFPTIPFVGMEPAVKPAVEATRSGVIGVLTTQATADGPLYARVLSRFAGNVRVMTQVAPELVHIVEANSQHTPESRAIIQAYLKPMLEAGVDQIALACTHFPFLAETIQEMVGPDVGLIDPSAAIARQVSRIWPQDVIPGRKDNLYFTSGSTDNLRRMLKTLIGVDTAAVDGMSLSE